VTRITLGFSAVNGALLSTKEASLRLGIAPTTLYDWLGRSDHGMLVIRGEPVKIRYFQGGPAGQGRIRIEAEEVDRLLELTRVVPQQMLIRKTPVPRDVYPGIVVRLGRPNA
jgi:hypothetical protein